MITITEEVDRLKRLIILLDILNMLTKSNDYTLVGRQGGLPSQSILKMERINGVLGYIAKWIQVINAILVKLFNFSAKTSLGVLYPIFSWVC